MKFQLVGEMECWIEVHNDGYPKTVLILEEFDADDVDLAIKKSKEIIYKKIYGSNGVTDDCDGFLKLKVELRVIEPIWETEVTPKAIKVKKPTTVTRPHFSEKFLK